jgi:hypothetical protein
MLLSHLLAKIKPRSLCHRWTLAALAGQEDLLWSKTPEFAIASSAPYYFDADGSRVEVLDQGYELKTRPLRPRIVDLNGVAGFKSCPMFASLYP